MKISNEYSVLDESKGYAAKRIKVTANHPFVKCALENSKPIPSRRYRRGNLTVYIADALIFGGQTDEQISVLLFPVNYQFNESERREGPVDLGGIRNHDCGFCKI